MSTRSDVTARRVFVALMVISIALLLWIIWPFAEAFLLAAVLAGALSPLEERMANRFRRLKQSRSLSAGLLCAAVVLVLMLPVGGLTAFVVRSGTEWYRFVAQTVRSEGVMGLVDRLPGPIQGGTRRLMERLQVGEEMLNESLGEQVTAQGGKAARAVGGFLSATGTVVLQAVMMLIALFFLLVDGRRLVGWLEEVAPVRPGQVREILVEFGRVSVAVMLSSLATAAVQALAALIGYLVARVPHPFFFAFVTFLVAFVPAVGAAGVCLLAAGLLAVTGHTVAAIFLAVWAVAVVGLVDNVIKPILVKRGLTMHGAIVFFALLGGLAAFGTIGLLLGPMIVAFFLALVRIQRREYAAQSPAPDPPCV